MCVCVYYTYSQIWRAQSANQFQYYYSRFGFSSGRLIIYLEYIINSIITDVGLCPRVLHVLCVCVFIVVGVCFMLVWCVCVFVCFICSSSSSHCPLQLTLQFVVLHLQRQLPCMDAKIARPFGRTVFVIVRIIECSPVRSLAPDARRSAAAATQSTMVATAAASLSRWRHGRLQGPRKVGRKQALLGGALLGAHQPALLLLENTNTKRRISKRKPLATKGMRLSGYLVLWVVVLDDADRVAHLEAQLVHVLLHVLVRGLHAVQATRWQLGARRICWKHTRTRRPMS